ncbi:MAG: hypothetical protein CMJ94_00845 [Planctomycetes bacterium]|nr:hypothetical protein [Planctomycetota bacterium]
MLSLLSPVLLLAAALPQQPRAVQRLTSGDIECRRQELAVDGDFAVAAWSDQGTAGVRRAWVSTSDGRGVDWSPARLAFEEVTGEYWRYEPEDQMLAVADGVIYLGLRIFEDPPGKEFLFLTRSEDQGQTWSEPVKLPPVNLASNEFLKTFQIVAEGDRVHAMAYFNVSGSDRIVVASSQDRGRTWANLLEPDQQSARITGGARVHVEDGVLTLAWADNRNSPGSAYHDVFLNRSVDGGQTWAHAQDIQVDDSAAGTGKVDATRPLTIAGGDQGLVMGWIETFPGDEPDLVIRYSADGGQTWTQPSSRMARRDGPVEEFGLDFDGTTIVTTFREINVNSGYSMLWCGRSRQFGAAWKLSNVAPSSNYIEDVQLTGNGDTWAVLCEDSSIGRIGSWYAVTRDAGKTWSALQPMLPEPRERDQVDPRVAWSERYQNILVAWIDLDWATFGARDELDVGGFRVQTLQAVSPSFTPGDPVHFEASLFPEADAGADFVVFVSRSLENFHLPWGDGRNLGLGPNGFLPGQLAVLSGTLDADGFGATVPTTVPQTPGVTWYAAAMSYRVSATTGRIEPQTLTDTIAIKVQ